MVLEDMTYFEMNSATVNSSATMMKKMPNIICKSTKYIKYIIIGVTEGKKGPTLTVNPIKTVCFKSI